MVYGDWCVSQCGYNRGEEILLVQPNSAQYTHLPLKPTPEWCTHR